MRKIFFGGILLLFSFVTFAQKPTLDKRAYAYYTQDEINAMPDFKIKQINYLYQQSFEIPEEFKEQINPDDIDIRRYSKQRLPNKKVKVYLYNSNAEDQKEHDNFSGQYIYLISIEDLQNAYENIK